MGCRSIAGCRLVMDGRDGGVLLGLLVGIGLSLRRGEFGLDLIAALAMAGALALGEYLAGIIIALMYTGVRRWRRSLRGARGVR
jgi:hypothetical protein